MNILAAGLIAAVGPVGLLELPAVDEQPIEVDTAIGDEVAAVLLVVLREGPRPAQCDLPAQQVAADAEHDLAAFANSSGLAPRCRTCPGP